MVVPFDYSSIDVMESDAYFVVNLIAKEANMQMTIRIPKEYMTQVQDISLRTGLKKSDIARLAIKEFLDRFDVAQGQEDKPINKASDLIGVVSSGIPDLGRNHRRHILKGMQGHES